MKFHGTLIETLLKTYEVNSGWTEERKLRSALENLDISVYTREDGSKILVSTSELRKHMSAFEAAESQRRELEAQKRGK